MGSTPANRPLFQRRAPLVVLEALLMGISVKMDREEWFLKDGVFGVKRLRHTLGRPELDQEVLLGVDLYLPSFVQMCERLSVQELLEISANIGLNRARRDQIKFRPF